MYKVFVNDKVVFLFTRNLDNHQVYSNLNSFISANLSPKKLVSLMLSSDEKVFKIILDGDLDKAFLKWSQAFNCIDAAGGLVINSEKEFLGIKRLGKWDLPKGKAELKEDMATTALREVEEECGISGLKIEEFLINTYHVYYHKEQYVLKRTYWYLMSWDGSGLLSPQIEEDITDVRWFRKDEKNIFESNTYASINEVLKFIQ